uniref:Small EDRK-rich factor-like N-terminal domain-containing protein n=1 Tax=Oryza meridionalis TaxID=40149 RepID=A0A0E0F555_9ORYZ
MITDIWAIQSLGPTEQSPFSPNRSLPQTPHRLPKYYSPLQKEGPEREKILGELEQSAIRVVVVGVGEVVVSGRGWGSQRDRDRERAQARKPNAKGPQDGLTPEQRRERDKKALEEKAAKKAAQAAGGGTSTDNKNKAGGAKK